MRFTRYANANDFFELFESDTFDVEHTSSNGKLWQGYLQGSDGLELAAEFKYSTEDCGKGWYDETLL